MLLRKKMNDPNVLMQFGLVFIILGGFVTRFHPATAFYQGLADGLMGTFYGAGIAALLLSVWRRNRPHTPCA